MVELFVLAILLIAALAGLAARGGLDRRAAPSARGEALQAPPAPPSLDKLPYQRKWYILSQAERVFYNALCAAAGKDLLVFAKVRLLDVLWVPKTARDRQSHLSRVMPKRVDFVLCDRRNLSPVLVVELDDAYHRPENQAARDAMVDAALWSAALPILRVPVQRAYDVSELAEELRANARTWSGTIGPPAGQANSRPGRS